MTLVAHRLGIDRRFAATVVVSMAVALLLLTSCARPASTFEAYLHAVAGGEEDRGWHYLGEIARQTYDDDVDAYLADVRAANWSVFLWQNLDSHVIDDDFSLVHVDVPSGVASVPDFLIQHHILSGACSGDEPDGLFVTITAGRCTTRSTRAV